MADKANMQTIVQRMIDAGEPEEAIASVIQHFNKPSDEKGILGKTWDVANTSLIPGVAEKGKEFGEAFSKPSLNQSKGSAMLSGALGGVAEGAMGLISGMATPLNIATALLGGGAAKYAGSTIGKVLGLGTKALSAPVAAEGAIDLAHGDPMGAVELAGGMAGIGSGPIKAAGRGAGRVIEGTGNIMNKYQPVSGMIPRFLEGRTARNIEKVVGKNVSSLGSKIREASAANKAPFVERTNQFTADYDPIELDAMRKNAAKVLQNDNTRRAAPYLQVENPSANLDPRIAGNAGFFATEAPKVPIKVPDSVDLSKKQFNMAHEIPESEIRRSGPLKDEPFDVSSIKYPGNDEFASSVEQVLAERQVPRPNAAQFSPETWAALNKLDTEAIDLASIREGISRPANMPDMRGVSAEGVNALTGYNNPNSFEAITGGNPIYHGTQNVFNKFDNQPRGSGWGNFSGMSQFSENPEYTSLYSLGEFGNMKRDGGVRSGGSPNTIPAKIDAKNVLDLTGDRVSDEAVRVLEELIPQLKSDAVRKYDPQYIMDLLNTYRGDLPFDAIRFSEHGRKNWAVPKGTNIRTPAGVPLTELSLQDEANRILSRNEPIDMSVRTPNTTASPNHPVRQSFKEGPGFQGIIPEESPDVIDMSTVQKPKGIPPERRAKIHRGAHDPVDVFFKDTESREAFGAASGNNIRKGGYQRFSEMEKRLVKDMNLMPQQARNIIMDYHQAIKDLAKEQPKYGNDMTLDVPSLREFIAKRKK